MMLRTKADRLPAPIREELLHVTTILFEAFCREEQGQMLRTLSCGPPDVTGRINMPR